MAHKVGQIIARGDRRWLIRIYLGRDRETNKRNYHNRTIHGPMREAQAYLTKKLRERDLGRDLEGAKITLNEYLDRWLETAVKPRVREKTCQDYDGMMRRYIRPSLGERVLAAMRPMDVQTTYQKMIERGLSARTVRYTHAVLKSAIRQALQWRLLLENPVAGVKVPQQPKGEIRSLTVEQAKTFVKAALATPHGPVLAVALTTGMRPSEYLGLKWQDIDWARQTVSVRSIRKIDGRWCFCDTKRSRSRRPIKLQRWIVLLLRNYRRERARTICVRRLMTWSSEPRRDVQSVAIISRSISDQYSTSPGCRESDSTICATRQPQSRWQPVCRRKLSLSNSDMPARPSRWIPMLTCFHTCRTRLPLGLRQCCLERRCDD